MQTDRQMGTEREREGSCNEDREESGVGSFYSLHTPGVLGGGHGS